MEILKKIVFISFFGSLLLIACNNAPQPIEKIIVARPEQMDSTVNTQIKGALEYALSNQGKINDTITLAMDSSVNDFYGKRNFENVWSKNTKWNPMTDSLFTFIKNAEWYGLFPSDYHLKQLTFIKDKLDNDTTQRKDASLWTIVDLILTDGFMKAVHDIRFGRINQDSISQKKSLAVNEDFYSSALKQLFKGRRLESLMDSLQPRQKGYLDLKSSIRHFVTNMDRTKYTFVKYPYDSKKAGDSLRFVTALKKRLLESNCLDSLEGIPDTIQLQDAIKKYQKLKGIKPDGRISESFVKMLNNTDDYRFKRIALTLDRYKLLPDSMPDKYIWVNLPGYYMYVMDNDTIVFESKIICGKPSTKTPQLNSYITDMITYPTWTVPNSIIMKDLLPKLKINPNILAKRGLHLVDKYGENVDPASVNWSKYKKGIPYKIMQGSGDDNALGDLKFNFANKYSVYLHDTNERFLFKRSTRALSHGCVRVQDWYKLAFFIAKNDSLNTKDTSSIKYTSDSIINWLARKQHKFIRVNNKIPLFIRYFTCEGTNGKLKFYDDIYGEDEKMISRFLSGK